MCIYFRDPYSNLLMASSSFDLATIPVICSAICAICSCGMSKRPKMGVSIGPGLIALTRMPSPAQVAARVGHELGGQRLVALYILGLDDDGQWLVERERISEDDRARIEEAGTRVLIADVSDERRS